MLTIRSPLLKKLQNMNMGSPISKSDFLSLIKQSTAFAITSHKTLRSKLTQNYSR